VNRILILYILILCYSCSGNHSFNQEGTSFENLQLQKYSQDQLTADFDLMVNSLKEAHTGLYWYSSEAQFDSVVAVQRKLIKDSLNGLQFYNIAAPIVAYSKEDHCDIYLSDDINRRLNRSGLFLPLSVIHLNNKTYLLNSPVSTENIKGFELVAINGLPLTQLYERLFNTFAADGYILSSKYRSLDFRGLSREYAKVICQRNENTVTVVDPLSKKEKTFTVASVLSQGLTNIHRQVSRENTIRREITSPAELKFLDDQTAMISFRTFSNKNFEKSNMRFKSFVDSSFKKILSGKVKALIIDIRDNGGGSEGNEDFLFSYLTSKPYQKYRYVEVSKLSFSFFDHTDYSSKEDREALEVELKFDNEQHSDGKYYRKPGRYAAEPVKANAFKGSLFVLTSGWTYSGGAEFASLVKEHTNAVFIGEEAGGGFNGNTSGTSLELTLPNTKLKIDIPILRFVLDVKKGEFGRGVIPDYSIQPTFEQFIKGEDVELQLAQKLIRSGIHNISQLIAF
jgi:hypothetical protein